eukprot:gene14998-16546_t
MAELDAEDELIDDDYYSILNVRKEASDDEIKAAYRRMCALYHPDKHQGSDRKQVAEQLFTKVGKAYEVLSDQSKRNIYDIYGHRGLKAGWEVVEKYRTQQEIKEEYERLQRELEDRRLQQRTNPKGSISVTVNATDLFDESYDNDYYLESEGMLPNIEVKGMTIHQSIEAPLTRSDTAVLSGTLQVQNGIGSGNVGVSLRRIISHQAWGEVGFEAGDGPKIQLRGFRHITNKMYGTVSLDSQFRQNQMSTGLQAMIMRQLGHHTTGYLTWRGGSQSSMLATVDRKSENHHINANLQVGVFNTFATFNYQYHYSSDTRFKFAAKYILAFGPILEYGCDHQITGHSRLAGSMTIGAASGVTLKMKLVRYNQAYSFPILLSEAVSPSAIFYGTCVPLLTYWAVKTLIVNPFLKKEEDRDLQSQKEKYGRQMVEKRQEAEAAVELMQETYRRSVEQEQDKNGLVIIGAWYGKLVSSERSDLDTPKIIDVCVPLQCLVSNSKLIVTEASKSQINGFYDPCVGEEKSLKVRYEFRGALHEVVVQDDELLRIPVQCK